MNQNIKFKLTALIFLLVTNSYGQEVKLGLPIGHTDEISAIQFSPDSKFLLTASKDKTAKIFDNFSGKLIHSFEGNKSWVTSANFSFDGNYISLITFDNSVKIFNTLTGKIVNIFNNCGPWTHTAKISPNNKFIVIASDHDTANIYNIESGKLWKKLTISNSYIKDVYISPNSKYATVITKTANEDTKFKYIKNNSKVFLFDIENEKIKSTFSEHNRLVNSAKFSSDGNFVITASNDGFAKIFRVNNGNLVNSINVSTSEVIYADFLNGGELITTITSDNILREINIETGKVHQSIPDWNDNIKISNNQKYVAIVNENGKGFSRRKNKFVKIVYVGITIPVVIIQTPSNRVLNIENVKISPNDKYYSVISDKMITVFEVSSGKLTHSYMVDLTLIKSIEFSENSERLLILFKNNSVKTLNLNKKTTEDLFNKETLISKLSPHGKFGVIVSIDSVSIFDIHLKRINNRFSIDNLKLKSGEFSPSSNLIVLEIKDNSIRIFDILSEKIISKISLTNGSKKALNFSPSEKLIGFQIDHQLIDIYEVKTGQKLSTVKSNNINSFQFCPDDETIVVSNIGEDAKIYDTATGSEIFELKESNPIAYPSGAISVSTNILNFKINPTTAIFSNNGNLVCSTSIDYNYIKVYDSKTGMIKDSLIGHSEVIRSINYSHNGKYLISSSFDGSIIIYDTKTGTQLIRSFIFDSDPNKWLHLHPSGLFDASPEAMELMYWTKGLEIIEFSQLKDRYWLPGLWEKVLRGDKLPDVRKMGELKLQPEVELNTISDETVTIHLKKREGGYGKVTLFLNGKEAINDIRPSDMDYSLLEQTITVSIKDHPYLINGDNEITVKASSEDGFVQGRGAKLKTVIEKKAVKQPQFFGVVIGVGDYANDQINLRYTVNDAEAISKAMKIGAENLFDKERVHMYTITSKSDSPPTKQTIRNVFTEIAEKSNAEDIITVYLSGHGITWGGEQGDFYFLTADAMATNSDAYSDPVIRDKHTISTSEWVDWLKNISALKQVMIIDACGSGKAVDNLIAERDIEPSQIKAIDRMKDRTGMYIISGCTADAVSYEASMYGQGLLTYSILQAIKGAALKEDKFVDVSTILNYARERVPDLAKGIGGIQEPQLLIPRGGSFDIGLLNSKDKEAIPLANPKTVFVRSTLVDANDFEDHLGLTEQLNEELSVLSTRGSNAPLVYFDASKFPNACKISGGYTVGDNNISISLKIRCGEELNEFDLKSDNKENLIKKIVELLEE